MRPFYRNPIVLIIVVVALIGVGFFIVRSLKKVPVTPPPQVEEPKLGYTYEVIGKSVEGRKIESYTYVGTGPLLGTSTNPAKKHVVFVGGMHGGYEWNSVLLAYQFMDYLKVNPTAIPANLTVTIIPAINPDGVFKVIGKEGRFTQAEIPAVTTEVSASGRFNAHGIDLNRNFGCHWAPTSMWQSKTVSAGTSAFSEPEAAAIRDYALKYRPDGFVFWHSQANAVYASECDNGVLPGTTDIMNAYAKAAGYPAVASFTAYKITGDSEGWLASIGIPAITVELKTHETTEWDKNLAGIKALLEYYGKK